TGAFSLGAVGLNWQVVGFGNFSSVPGEGDMLMRNMDIGFFQVYDISNNQVTGVFGLGAVGLDWQVAGFGPISRPGASDMVLRNANTGDFEIYNIANNQITRTASMWPIGLGWQVDGFAADPPIAAMGTSDYSTSQLVQAMAGFGDGGGPA